MTDSPPAPPTDFIRELVVADQKSGKFGGRVHTRFPPEPNGYLHIGHAKSICLNFGIAEEFGGLCNLRYDDTNPCTEEEEYVLAIQRDVRWLGFDWGDRLYHASDFYEECYRFAEQLIEQGKAYVDSLTAEEISHYRGAPGTPGRNSPYRDRTPAENLDMFRRMRAGEYPDGAHVLRAKIDMAHPNINLRDPVLYRIRREAHYRTGTKWVIYPMYDYAHPICDSLERITHSLCTLEFEHHRPLYDWFLIELGIYRPQQIEFARLNITHTVLSKRKLLQLVNEKLVRGWDDPRMPTISALRRRGYPPAAIRRFCREVGVAKYEATHQVELLEHCVREELNLRAERRMGVLRPLKLVLENYPAGRVEGFETGNNPEDAAAGTRTVPFSRELWIEHGDFRETPPPKYFRLSPGTEVRLRSAYLVRCTGVERDSRGEVVAVRATYDPASRGGNAPDGRKVKSTIHWVSAAHAVDAEVRLYDHLFAAEHPDAGEGGDWKAQLNQKSEEVVRGAKLEPALRDAPVGATFQLERVGYFCADQDGRPGAPVLNRTVTLKDSWAKLEKKQPGG
jgi:glutaminyl-tRNA synthetase